MRSLTAVRIIAGSFFGRPHPAPAQIKSFAARAGQRAGQGNQKAKLLFLLIMSYLVLARKYRPASFESVSGQEHVTRTLANAIKRDKVAHAYLFSGPRGVGKTSIARIFAKSLNCQQGPTESPCLQCTNCSEIAEGNSLAVREIDGASHTGVDNVRELIDSFRSLPAPGSRYKIYIIDEVHMLSASAFNALLKSLEEPPPNTVLILATTEAHKIPETVISRCQRFDLRALSVENVEQCLLEIASKEDIDIEPEVLRMIARLSDGSMRDAQSLLDRVQSFCEGRITAAETSQVLGVVEKNVLLELSKAVFSHDVSHVLNTLHQAFSVGLSPAVFLKEFAAHWRELLLAKFGGIDALKQISVSEDLAELLIDQVKDVSNQDLQDLVQLARDGADAALRTAYPKYAIEALLVRMAARSEVKDIGILLGQLRTLLSEGIPAGSKRKSPAQPIARKAAPAPKKKIAAAKSEQKTEPAAITEPAIEKGQATGINWSDFVEFVSEKGAMMLAEHLRRLSVECFSDGVLEAKGPEFSVSALERKDNRDKLFELLQNFSKVSRWSIKISNGLSASQPEPGSLKEVEEKKAKRKKKEKTDNLLSHPKVQVLKKAFPHSTVEGIKLKE